MADAHVDPAYSDLRLQFQVWALATTVMRDKAGPDGESARWLWSDFTPPWYATEPPGRAKDAEPEPAVLDEDAELAADLAALLGDPNDPEAMTPEQTRAYLAGFMQLYGGHDPGDQLILEE